MKNAESQSSSLDFLMSLQITASLKPGAHPFSPTYVFFWFYSERLQGFTLKSP